MEGAKKTSAGEKKDGGGICSGDGGMGEGTHVSLNQHRGPVNETFSGFFA